MRGPRGSSRYGFGGAVERYDGREGEDCGESEDVEGFGVYFVTLWWV